MPHTSCLQRCAIAAVLLRVHAGLMWIACPSKLARQTTKPEDGRSVLRYEWRAEGSKQEVKSNRSMGREMKKNRKKLLETLHTRKPGACVGVQKRQGRRLRKREGVDADLRSDTRVSWRWGTGPSHASSQSARTAMASPPPHGPQTCLPSLCESRKYVALAEQVQTQGYGWVQWRCCTCCGGCGCTALHC